MEKCKNTGVLSVEQLIFKFGEHQEFMNSLSVAFVLIIVQSLFNTYLFFFLTFPLKPCLVDQTWLSPVGSVSMTGTSCWASSSCLPAYRSLRGSHPSVMWCWTRSVSQLMQIAVHKYSHTNVLKPPSAKKLIF